MTPFSSQTLRLGFSYSDAPFYWGRVVNEVSEHAVRHGMKLIYKGADCAAQQVAGVKAMLKTGVDVLMVSPVLSDTPELLPLLNAARAEGIGVILVAGQDLPGAESFPLIRGDTASSQRVIADVMCRHLGGKGKVAHIQTRQSKWNRLRVEALHDVLALYPDIRLVKNIERDPSLTTFSAASDVGLGYRCAQEIIAEHPDIGAILVGQGTCTPGVLHYLREVGLADKVALSSFDGNPDCLKAVKQGFIVADVYTPPSGLAQHVIDHALAFARGESVPPVTLVPPQLVTRDNVAEVAFSLALSLPQMIETQRELIATISSNEERFRSLVELSSDWYWEQDEQFRFVTDNDKPGQLPACAGLALWDIPGVEADEAQWSRHRALLKTYLPFFDFEFAHVDADGVMRYFTMSGRPVLGRDGKFCGYRGVAKDISERRLIEKQIQRLAYYDPLSGLPNRNLFQQHVNHALALARRHNRRLALMLIEFDSLQAINDDIGQGIGDRLLGDIGWRLRQSLREADILSRSDNNAFLLLLEDLANTEYVTVVAHKILATISAPITLDGTEYRLTASIGASIFPDHGSNKQMLMKFADDAMYAAKQRQENEFGFYSEKTETDTAATAPRRRPRGRQPD